VAELCEAFGVESEMVPGRDGIFDVYIDEKLVFSKFETGQFPKPGEIIQKIKE